ncbi:MAG: hypothetical protein HY866_18595 [Chloroflexi bacterium]|nr:hypothetical protein [Chloroflexota bacterium]
MRKPNDSYRPILPLSPRPPFPATQRKGESGCYHPLSNLVGEGVGGEAVFIRCSYQHPRYYWHKLLALLLVFSAALLLGLFSPAHAQDTPARVEVFLAQNLQTGEARISFMDPLSGLSRVVNVENGQRFLLVGNYVLYEKVATGAVMRANADGTLEPHPFIRRAVDTRSLYWVASADGRAVAWVQVNQAGVSEAYTALADGSDLRQLPISTPGAALELFPLAITNDPRRFFYDAAHPVPATDNLYDVFTHVVEYHMVGEVFVPLPDEPNCPCAASISADGRILGRLEAAQGIGPFALHIWDMPTGADILIPAPGLPFRVAGDLLLNNTGTLAVYSASAEAAGGQHTLILADMVTQSQIALLTPGPARYRPLAFIDEDNALLLAGISEGGTYKFDLANKTLQRVSNEIYLGTITAE